MDNCFLPLLFCLCLFGLRGVGCVGVQGVHELTFYSTGKCIKTQSKPDLIVSLEGPRYVKTEQLNRDLIFFNSAFIGFHGQTESKQKLKISSLSASFGLEGLSLTHRQHEGSPNRRLPSAAGAVRNQLEDILVCLTQTGLRGLEIAGATRSFRLRGLRCREQVPLSESKRIATTRQNTRIEAGINWCMSLQS